MSIDISGVSVIDIQNMEQQNYDTLYSEDDRLNIGFMIEYLELMFKENKDDYCKVD